MTRFVALFGLSLFAMAPTWRDLPRPRITKPSPGVVYATPLAIEWENTGADVDVYELDVWGPPNGDILLQETIANGTDTLYGRSFTLPEYGTYAVQVWARFASTGEWTESSVSVVCRELRGPEIETPSEGEVVGTSSVVFGWGAVPDALEYTSYLLDSTGASRSSWRGTAALTHAVFTLPEPGAFEMQVEASLPGGLTTPRTSVRITYDPSQPPPNPTSVLQGSSSPRRSILFLGDGYTQAEIPKYVDDVRSAVDHLFDMKPFKNLKSHFNVWRIDLVSVDSGISIPNSGIHRDTALGAYKYSYDRVVYFTNTRRMDQILARHPFVETIVLLVNSAEYGGVESGRGHDCTSEPPEPNVTADEYARKWW
jgi:hypothetical protein